jgi:hypothetical protein
MNDGFWGILVFPAIALVIAIVIVWWTMPRSGRGGDKGGDAGPRD